MPEKYVVKLTERDRIRLDALAQIKKSPRALTYVHSRVLLMSDVSGKGEMMEDSEICAKLKISAGTVRKVRRDYALYGIDKAISRKRHVYTKFLGKFKPKLIALAQGPPPKGRPRWTHRRLAKRMIELRLVDTVSPTTVERILKENGIFMADRRGISRDDFGRYKIRPGFDGDLPGRRRAPSGSPEAAPRSSRSAASERAVPSKTTDRPARKSAKASGTPAAKTSRPSAKASWMPAAKTSRPSAKVARDPAASSGPSSGRAAKPAARPGRR
ncbi:MAG: hypothetical protein LBQ79_11660 [Deltaproteobacteria bacterium]|nr:hypothetical protein [Deltaproteobacteria bacterium]